MGTRPHHSDAAPAALEVVFRGLYAALLDDAALRNSLVMFLPYYVTYDGPLHSVRLIHPVATLRLEFPHAGPARRFLLDNRHLMNAAAKTGRDSRSLAHKLVKRSLLPHEQKDGGYISPEYRGQVQYREILARESQSKGIRGVEYDVDACPHVYPVLGILRQVGGRMIGMVSMDFNHRLCEKVAGVFNSFMNPYGRICLWDELKGTTLREFYAEARMEGSWCAAGKPAHNGFSDSTAVQRACDEIHQHMNEAAWNMLSEVLKAAPEECALLAHHRILKALQGADQIVPALWACLGNGASGGLSADHFTLQLKAFRLDGPLADVNLAAGDLHEEWQWSDCLWVPPSWVLLRGPLDDVARDVAIKWLEPNDGERRVGQRGFRGKLWRDGQRGFRGKLWKLARAISTAWPEYVPLVEVRMVRFALNPATTSQIVSALRSLHPLTPVGAIFGTDKRIIVAVRGSWRKA